MAKKKREEVPQIAIQVGKAIARQRKFVGKTQRQVAEEMDTGVETISRLESGAILQTVDRLYQLAVVLECPLTNFFLDAPDDVKTSALALADMLHTLAPEQRGKALYLMAELVRVLR